MEYVFIGAGNMGWALAAALIGKGICKGGDIHVVDPDAACRNRLANLDCTVAEAADDQVSQAKVVLLAVKPQIAGEVMAQVKPLLGEGQVVVSIMAGVTLSTMQNTLGTRQIVRVMPNTPAQVGLGMNVYYAAPQVTPAQLKPVKALLESSGEAMSVESEDAIDAATAVSGSGPAYVFYLAEHWMKAAEKLGFTAEQAALLIQQTLIGATALWKDSGKPPGDLRQQVTSKGGTTAAALEQLESNENGQAFMNAVQKAYDRAKELAKG